MTQTQTELQTEIMEAQNKGVDLFGLLTKREYAFLSGSFTPTMNYARQLRFTIRQKVTKALGNPNGHEQKCYESLTSLGKVIGNHEAKRSGVLERARWD